MRKTFDLIRGEIDPVRLMADTEALWKKEFGGTFEHFRQASLFAEQLLREAGLAQVERIAHPADGKTVCQDKTMPLAWRASRGKLEVIRSAAAFDDPVVADYEKHPYHLMQNSAGTPPEGIITRLISEDELLAGTDARNAMILLHPENRPNWARFARVCDAGALGIVSDYLIGRYWTPDGVQWVNAFSDGPGWHRRADGRSLVGFSVSPETGDRLREALRAGRVTVRVSSDARHCPGEFHTVTAVLPGRESREVWLLAHLYEPLADDNSAGVIGALEIARTLKRLYDRGLLAPPRFSLRLVFSLEMYGFAAYAEKRGGYLGDQALAAFNLDGMPSYQGMASKLIFSPPGSPFFGDYLLEEMTKAGLTRELTIAELEREGQYYDDLFLSDATTGLPSYWLCKNAPARNSLRSKRFWHNSKQTMAVIDPEYFRESLAFIGTWAALVTGLEPPGIPAAVRRASLDAHGHLLEEAARLETGPARSGNPRLDLELRLCREQGRLRDFRRVTSDLEHLAQVEETISRLAREKERLAALLPRDGNASENTAPRGAAWARAGKIVIRRTARGFPYDLDAVPRDERKPLPDSVIYGPLARIMAGADGQKTLDRLMLEAQWETGKAISDSDAARYTGAVQYLDRYGYLEAACAEAVGGRDIADALAQAGVGRGDLLLVHGSLSALGFVKGGPGAVVDALLEHLGPDGTLLMPAFTQSITYFIGLGPVRRPDFRPFRPDRTPSITGVIGETFRRRPGVVRSAHPSHSVAGSGPLARACLEAHRETDPPTGRSSPFGKLRELGGKMAWLGADLKATTFLHYIETESRLPYLLSAVCVAENPDGATRSLLVPEHLPGCRDFYRTPAEESRVYRALAAAGLEIRRAPLGDGELKVIDCRRMYDLGMKIVAETPDIMLCEREECSFCRKYRR